jgi:hypothetical protein
MVAVDYWALGDTAELDRIETELGKVSEAVAATADAVAELEENGGIMFPYDPVIEQNIRVFADIGFKAAAKKYGDHWELPPGDTERLSVATAQVINHYMPDLANLGPVGNLGLIAVSIIAPRVILTKMQARSEQQAANDEGVTGE